MTDVRGLAILGSTGSIGRTTLSLLQNNRLDFQVVLLTGHNNIPLLAEQCRLFEPSYAYTTNPSRTDELSALLENIKTEVVDISGLYSLLQSDEIDCVMASIVGIAGLKPVLKAVEGGKDIFLANKEALVCAGELLFSSLKKSGARLLPVDSEHNAIFQCLSESKQQRVVSGEGVDGIDKLILTASGGPFLNMNDEELKQVTPEMACRHPNWSMGKKISVDSATLMNKGLEMIEAHYIFQVPYEDIEVVIHPQSVVHSMVRYQDGSHIAQLGVHDMALPISHCLQWPQRVKLEEYRNSEFLFEKKMTFSKPSHTQNRCILISMAAANLGQSACIVLNGANELAVNSFIQGQVGFERIPDIITEVLEKVSLPNSQNNVEEIIHLDKVARLQTSKCIEKYLNN